MTTPLDIALDYIRRGWCPLPIPYRAKGPIVDGWPGLRLDASTAPNYFGLEPQNIGVLLGEPSGWLADVDLDCAESVRLASDFLPPTRSRFGRDSRRNSHWLYVATDLKTEGFDLKEEPESKTETTILELRSVNVQTVFPGSTHKDTGEPVTWDEDGPPTPLAASTLRQAAAQLAIAAVLVRAGWTETDAKIAARGQPALLAEALAVPQIGPEIGKWLGLAPAATESKWRPTQGGDRPGDDFNRRASWAEVLEPYGWKPTASRSGKVNWCRPGKASGTSATVNYADSDLLYVFSTSTPFEPRRGYSKFTAHTLLSRGGVGQEDFREAARELAARGYGAPDPEPADLTGILARATPKVSPLPSNALSPPGLVGEIANWINATAVLPQPVLALGAAIALVSSIIGRRVRHHQGLRANIYILGIAESGSGKEHGRQCIKQILNHADAGNMEIEDFASDSGVYSALHASPSLIYLSDEFGRTLQTMSKPHAPAHLSTQIDLLMKLYGASKGTLKNKAYADRNKQITIQQPHLSAYLTTAPGPFHSALSGEYVEDGLLSRILPFVSDDPDPEYVDVDADQPPPDGIVSQVRDWLRRSVAPGKDGNLAEMIPEPIPVVETASATRVFLDLRNEMRDRRKKMRAGQESGVGLFTRVHAAAIKLALIRACGMATGDDEPRIREDDAIWGATLAKQATETLAVAVERNSANSNHEKHVKLFYRYLLDAGAAGLTKSALTKRSWRMNPYERTAALSTLEDSGRAIKVVEGEGRSSKTIYRIAQ